MNKILAWYHLHCLFVCSEFVRRNEIKLVHCLSRPIANVLHLSSDFSFYSFSMSLQEIYDHLSLYIFFSYIILNCHAFYNTIWNSVLFIPLDWLPSSLPYYLNHSSRRSFEFHFFPIYANIKANVLDWIWTRFADSVFGANQQYTNETYNSAYSEWIMKNLSTLIEAKILYSSRIRMMKERSNAIKHVIKSNTRDSLF